MISEDIASRVNMQNGTLAESAKRLYFLFWAGNIVLDNVTSQNVTEEDYDSDGNNGHVYEESQFRSVMNAFVRLAGTNFIISGVM